jgi:L-fuconolactonase
LELSDQHDFIRGVVGWVDMRSPRVKQQLQQFSRHPKLVGVRHIVQDEVDDRFMLEGDFLRGLGTLAEFGLTYDLLLFPKHLPIAVQVVQQFPDQRFVLDHIAKPFIAVGTLTPWADDIRALARFENVYCKVSGLVTEAAWGQWKAEDFRPYLDVVFEVFGPGRLMFGSDWPVCTLSADYSAVVGLVRDYTERFSDSDRNKLFGLNAAQFYGLPDATADHKA